MKEEWQAVNDLDDAEDKAERLGFKINRGVDNKVEITAQKTPYVIGCTIAWFNTFKEASAWLDGYSQHAFELKNTPQD
jgi:hypothetical protein